MNDNSETFSILRHSKSGTLPRVPFLEIKEKILGKKYILSLVFPTKTVATKLHLQWKQKSGPANVLSFPLSKKSGEIFISLDKARVECKKFDMDYPTYVAFLVIHGCLHLKGMQHGATMEKEERKFLKFFI